MASSSNTFCASQCNLQLPHHVIGNDQEELFGTGTFLVRSALTIYLWSASFGDITRCDQNFVYY